MWPCLVINLVALLKAWDIAPLFDHLLFISFLKLAFRTGLACLESARSALGKGAALTAIGIGVIPSHGMFARAAHIRLQGHFSFWCIFAAGAYL
jgi:hypothetical protein